MALELLANKKWANLSSPHVVSDGQLSLLSATSGTTASPASAFIVGTRVSVIRGVGSLSESVLFIANVESIDSEGNILHLGEFLEGTSDVACKPGDTVQLRQTSGQWNDVVNSIGNIVASNVPAISEGTTSKVLTNDGTASSWTNAPVLASATIGSGSGLAKLASGVVEVATAGTDYLTPSGSGASLTGISHTQVSGLGTAALASASSFADLTTNTFSGLQTGAIHDHGGTMFHVEAYRGGGSDDDAVAAAIAAADAAGGGTVVFGPQTYAFGTRIVLPVDGNSLPRQHFFRLTGSGRSSTVTDDSVYDGTTLDFGGISTSDGGYGCIEALGAGYLEVDRLTFLNSGSITDPYIYVTNTVLHCEKNTFVGNTSLSATSCNQDAIQLGSSTSSATSTGSVNSGFQGYGTNISHNMFQHIRRGVYCAIYSNGSVIRDNTWGLTCGGSSSYGAIEVMGISSAGTGGVVISGNLVELVGYIYGVRLSPYTVQCVVTDNTFWDGGAACIYIDNNSSGHVLISGTNPGGVPFIASAGTSYGANNTIVEQKLDGSGGICIGGVGIGAYNSVALEATVGLYCDGTPGAIGVNTPLPDAGVHVTCPNNLLRGLIVQATAGQQVPLFEVRHADGTVGISVDQYDELTSGAFIGTYAYFVESGALKWGEYVSGGTLYYRDLVNNQFLMSLVAGNPGFLQMFGSIIVGGGSLNVDGSYTPPTLVSTAAVNSSLFVGSDKSNALCWKDGSGTVHTVNLTP